MNSADWITEKSEVEYENPYMRVVRYEVVRTNGFKGPYYVLERTPFSVIIPMTPNLETYLVRQYRYPIQRYSWEFPMGAVAGKEALATAMQELKEETGLTAAQWDLIGQYAIAPGHNNQITKLYLARDLQVGEAQPEEGEFLDVEKVAVSKVGEMIADGEIIDGPTICAFHFLELYLKKNLPL
jgi:8-oxo-dGTP pyrophosphatase MutT (NUDIX family)